MAVAVRQGSLVIAGGKTYVVSETPEEIMNMIEHEDPDGGPFWLQLTDPEGSRLWVRRSLVSAFVQAEEKT